MATRRILLIAYAAILIYATHAPLRASLRPKSDSWIQAVLHSVERFGRGPLPGGLGRRDKLVHFVGYAVLTVLAFRTAQRHRESNSSKARRDCYRPHPLWIVLLLSGFGLFDECTQPLFARTLDWFDYVANLGGIAGGGLLMFSPIMKLRFGPCGHPSAEMGCQFPPDPAHS